MVMPSATDAAAKWAQNFGAAGDRWQKGVEGVTTAPNALAARAADHWLAQVTNAKPKYVAANMAVSREVWIERTVSKGRGRLSSGAQAGQPKMEAALVKLLPWIQQQVNALPPRGDLEANINRAAQFARGMAKFPGV